MIHQSQDSNRPLPTFDSNAQRQAHDATIDLPVEQPKAVSIVSFNPSVNQLPKTAEDRFMPNILEQCNEDEYNIQG